jgi:hypothetical protein
MMDLTRTVHEELTIRVDGNFDSSEACRLAGWLHKVPVGEPLVLDFMAARHCEDFDLATLAGELKGRTRVRVRGLSRHQEKLLRYLGVELRAPNVESRAAG